MTVFKSNGLYNEAYACYDHRHNKKKGDPDYVRSLTTNNCNVLIGLADENPEILEKAKIYLALFGGSHAAETQQEKINVLLTGQIPR